MNDYFSAIANSNIILSDEEMKGPLTTKIMLDAPEKFSLRVKSGASLLSLEPQRISHHPG
jgi:hypothetical protein